MPLPPPPKEKQKHEHTNETHYYTVYGQKTTLFSMCGDKDVNIILIPEVLGNRFVDNQPFHILLVSLCASKPAITYSQLFGCKMPQPWQH